MTLQPNEMNDESKSIEYIIDQNPVGVFRAMKEAQAIGSPMLPFIACKQKQTADYNVQEGAHIN